MPEVPILQAFETEFGMGWTRMVIAATIILALSLSLLQLTIPLHEKVSIKPKTYHTKQHQYPSGWSFCSSCIQIECWIQKTWPGIRLSGPFWEKSGFWQCLTKNWPFLAKSWIFIHFRVFFLKNMAVSVIFQQFYIRRRLLFFLSPQVQEMRFCNKRTLFPMKIGQKYWYLVIKKRVFSLIYSS